MGKIRGRLKKSMTGYAGALNAPFDPLLHMNLDQIQTEKLKTLQYYESKEWFIDVSVLQSGHTFGELALITYQKRAATIQCLSETVYFATLEKSEF